MQRWWYVVVAIALASDACGGGDGGEQQDLPNPGFAVPEITTAAFSQSDDGGWEEVGPADWSCLGTPSGDEPTTVPMDIVGVVRDFQTGDEVGDAAVSLFAGTDLAGTPIDAATSDVYGSYALELPAGHERVSFLSAADGYLPTYLVNQYFDPSGDARSVDLEPISLTLANALPAFIDRERTLGKGVLAGAIRDCAHHEVSGAIATVSSTSAVADHVDGAATYYFSAASTSLPERLSLQPYTNSDGLFMVIELSPSSADLYLQVWGFTPDQDPGSDELTLLAEIGLPVLADSVISASMEALRE
jgi:hypothetical protein